MWLILESPRAIAPRFGDHIALADLRSLLQKVLMPFANGIFGVH
ncbi:hypothetical protein [Leptolyngbya sp. O-77]|nr:hypothetical protein [Leptolyngbya sp. O-77]BAU42977.1 hypothetical protein O77CONTIG1_02799 [Leptolyngbya sp. O-77]